MSTDPDFSLRRRLAGPESSFVELCGVDTHVVVAGDTGPTVLLLHHFFGSAGTWRHVLAGLRERARIVAFDRPGFGLTQRPRLHGSGSRQAYTRAHAVDMALRLLDHLDADDAVIVGSSSGGTLALELFDRAPQRVRGLALLAPAITGDVGPPGALRPLLRPLFPLVRPWIHRLAEDITPARVGRGWHDGSQATDADALAYRTPLQIPGWDRAFWAVVTAERPPDVRHVLPRIDVPAVVVQGASDRTIQPRWSRRTAAAIPGARYIELPAVGHTPQEEAPDRLLPILGQLLDEIA